MGKIEVAKTYDERIALIRKIAEKQKKTVSKRRKIVYNNDMDVNEIVDNFKHTTNLDNDWN